MAMQYSWLDGIFEGATTSDEVIGRMKGSPFFLKAIADAVAAEASLEQERETNPHPGPLPGQAGRGAFLEAMNSPNG